MKTHPVRLWASAGVIVLGLSSVVPAQGAQQAPAPAADTVPQQAIVDKYCVTCHNPRTKAGRLSLVGMKVGRLDVSPEIWEKVTRKLKGGVMPPSGAPRPDEATLQSFVGYLEGGLDKQAQAKPNPGRTEGFHRLNRFEYQNAIRDLLALDIDAAAQLPPDDASYGFDNIAGVLKISQSLLERYLAVAKTVSRMALGGAPPAVDSKTYRVAPDMQQHAQVEGLPLGTRGGMLVRHQFPQNAEYEIRLEIAGRAVLQDVHKLEITIDGAPVKLFTVGPREQKSNAFGNPYDDADKLVVKLLVPAGPHDIGAAFYQKPNVLLEQVREPFQNPRVSGNDGGPGGNQPALTSVRVMGPFNASGPGDTPSRRRLFVCRPASAAEEPACASRILGTLARRAFRGPVGAEDRKILMDFFKSGRAETGTFEGGIELALRRLLVDPQFLYRIEAEPAAGANRSIYRVSDLELASRLSFFLWSSIPDDQLLRVAEQGTLRQPAVLRAQIARMLKDSRSDALTTNFAGQWLQLKNMDVVKPGDPFSLTFNDALRHDLRRETELFFDSIVRENRSAMDLLTADYTFLNERVAQHYNIPGIQGMNFRKVMLPANSPRRGILGHASVLTITSHAIRTSPVFRGKWVLNNIMGTPPPEPPANVPALVDKKVQARQQTMRERMAAHRANPTCSSCHSLIDPAGFALENFDAIGRWRDVDESYNRIDASGMLPDGTKFNGVAELRAVLARKPERFVTTLTERMLTYALGRGVEYYDMPAIRKVVHDAGTDNYRFQAIVRGIVESYPFQMRTMSAPQAESTTAQR